MDTQDIRMRCIELAARMEGGSVYDMTPVIDAANLLVSYVLYGSEIGLKTAPAPEDSDEIPF